MTRRLTALLAALEALLVLGVGLVIPVAVLTVVWAAHFGFDPDWTVFWRASADLWLLGHGVDVAFTLDPPLAAALGLPAAGEPVRVTLALLGFALLTVLLAVRAGRRVTEAEHPVLGALVAVAVFAAASVGVTATALHPAARPSLVQGAILPALVFAIGLAIGMLRTTGGPRAVERLAPEVRVPVAAALRAGAGAVALTTATAAVLVAALFVIGFPAMIGLYESLHTEVIGGIALTGAQLSILPNLVIWAVAWLVGPGFAIGAGSQVSPLGTALGPVPALPVLGALPTGDPAFAFVGLLVPVVAAFLAGVAVRPALDRGLDAVTPLTVAAVAAGAGVTGGVLLGVLAGASGGSAGPGRLSVVGPDPVVVGLVAALEFGIATAIGLAAASRRRRAPAAGTGSAERRR